LRGSSFKGCNFSHAQLRGANCGSLLFGEGSSTRRFSPCDFEGAKFRYSDLSKTQFKSASFRNADLSYANLSGCDLRSADFTGAILKKTNLDNCETEGAIFDKGNNPVFRLKGV